MGTARDQVKATIVLFDTLHIATLRSLIGDDRFDSFTLNLLVTNHGSNSRRGPFRMRQYPGDGVALDVADGAVALLFKIAMTIFEPAVEFIEPVFSLFQVGGHQRTRVALLLRPIQLGEFQALPVD